MLDTRATRERHEWHECDTSETWTTRVGHGCYTKTRVKNLIFDNDRSENMFSHSYISYVANEKLQGEQGSSRRDLNLLEERNNFILRTTFSKCLVTMPRCTPQKLNFVMAKTITKSYTLDCSCKCPCTSPHRYV